MATPPTRVSHTTPAAGYGSTATPKTTPTFDIEDGDLLTVIGISEDGALTLNTPTSDGTVTWTLRQSVVVANYCTAYAWTGAVTATATGRTVSVARGAGSGRYNFEVTVWRAHGGVGNSAKDNATVGVGIYPTLAVTCSDNSAIVTGFGDWTAQDGGTRTWATINSAAMTEVQYFRNAAAYTMYGAYRGDTGTAGSKTVGLTAGTGDEQKYAIVAVEVLADAAATAPAQVAGVSVSPRDTGVFLSWLAPDNGGSAITDYLVEQNVNGGGWTTFTDGTSTAVSTTVTGLTNGLSVVFRVSAINAIGTGTASPTSNATWPDASDGLTSRIEGNEWDRPEFEGRQKVWEDADGLSGAAATNAAAGVATGTGAASAATASVAPVAGLATGTGTAYQATAATGTNAAAEVATGTGTASAVKATVAPTAGLAAGTGTASAAKGSVAPTAGNAAGTGTASAAKATVAPTAGAATGTGTASASKATIAPTAGIATGTGTASAAKATVAPVAGLASGTGTAYDATATTSGGTSAPAELASGTGTAHAAKATVAPTAGVAAGTGAASAPSAKVSPTGGIATATGTAHNATVTVSVNVGNAAGTGTAFDPTASVAPVAGAATGTGTAHNATVTVSGSTGPAGIACLTVAASSAILSVAASTATITVGQSTARFTYTRSPLLDSDGNTIRDSDGLPILDSGPYWTDAVLTVDNSTADLTHTRNC